MNDNSPIKEELELARKEPDWPPDHLSSMAAYTSLIYYGQLSVCEDIDRTAKIREIEKKDKEAQKKVSEKRADIIIRVIREGVHVVRARQQRTEKEKELAEKQARRREFIALWKLGSLSEDELDAFAKYHLLQEEWDQIK
jgi:hypothetical protein